MSRVERLPNHLRTKRVKVFGDGAGRPLDRNAKARAMTLAHSLARRTEKGRHYGQITAKALAVFRALLYTFHNASSGLCFPSYEKIAEAAGCARSTVAEAIGDLEAAGLLTWCNRLVRVREYAPDLFGRMGLRWRVIRTSNAYNFRDPAARQLPAQLMPRASKSEIRSGTRNQELLYSFEGDAEAAAVARERLREVSEKRRATLEANWAEKRRFAIA